MKLKDFYLEKINNESGLSIFNAPTGTGKTYLANEIMRENYKTRKFFFIANQHILLPKMEDICKENDDSNLESQILYIPSILKSFKIHFSKIDIPLDFLKDNLLLIEDIKRQLDFIILDERSLDTYFAEEFYKLEKEFRNQLKAYINTKKEASKLNKIKETLNKNFIEKLYPQVLISQKQIIIMTTKKFFLPIDLIYESSINLFNVESKNITLFIDEFETTKKEITQIIIETTKKNYKVDPYRLFKRISNEIKYFDYKNIYDNQSSELNDYYNDLLKEFNNINDKYKDLGLRFKTRGINVKNLFLFNDKDNYLISNNKENSKLIYETNKNVNDILFSSNGMQVKDFLNDIIRVINYFSIFIYLLSIDYEKNENERIKQQQIRTKIKKNELKYESNMTFSECLLSIVDLLNLGEENKFFLVEKITAYVRRKNVFKVNDFDEKIDYRNKKYKYYYNGFSLTNLVDSTEHNFETKFQLFEYENTPELYILSCAKNYNIIGLSATGNINSSLVNYDLDFIETVLKENYYVLSEDQRIEKIKDEYRNKQKIIHQDIKCEINSNFEIKLVGVTNKDKLKQFLYNKNISLGNFTNILNTEDYEIGNLLSLIICFENFLNDNKIHSFIFFSNKSYNGKMASELESLFITLCNNDETVSYNFVVSSDIKSDWPKLQKELNTKRKVFIATTYQSIGAGVNLHYEVTEENKKYFYNEKLILKQEKDLDAIYLSLPSNVMTSFIYKDKSYESLSKTIFALEDLQVNNEISIPQFKASLENLFKKFNRKQDGTILAAKYSKIDMIGVGQLKVLIQALGRLTRKDSKNTINIIMKKEVLNIFVRYKRIIKKQWSSFLIEQVLEIVDQEKGILDSYNNLDNFIQVLKQFNNDKNILMKKWTFDTMYKWQKLREFVLINPTMSFFDSLFGKYYFKFDEEINEYSYKLNYTGHLIDVKKINNDFSNVYNSFSFEDSKLSRFLKIEGLEDYFNQNNYKIRFDKNFYLMNPVLFKSIYFGALGEKVGKFILKKYDLELEEIVNPEYFEKFDFVLNKNIYFDFKNWAYFEKDKTKAMSNVINKAKIVNATTVFIINILYEGPNKIDIVKDNDSGIEVISIPWLYNDKENLYNDEAIKLITKR